jgi:hypothetical protein
LPEGVPKVVNGKMETRLALHYLEAVTCFYGVRVPVIFQVGRPAGVVVPWRDGLE